MGLSWPKVDLEPLVAEEKHTHTQDSKKIL